jgi:hypothetical protein
MARNLMLMHGTDSGSGQVAALDLAPAATWSGHARHGLAITCERGSAWITVEGDPEDHVIAAPDTFASPARGRFAILALESARLRVEPASA